MPPRIPQPLQNGGCTAGEDQGLKGWWLPFPGEDGLICKMAARERERPLLAWQRVGASGGERWPQNLPPFPGCCSSGGTRKGSHHLHFLGDGHGVGGAAMRRRGAGRWPAGPPEAGGGEPAPRPSLPAVTLGGRRGPARRAAAPSSPLFLILFVFIYLFIYFGRGKSLKRARPEEGGEGGGRKRRPPFERPRDSACWRAQGDPSRSPCPLGARRAAAGGLGGRGRRPRRRGGDAAPGAVRPSCCWLRQPRRLPLLPLLASDSAHSQPQSLSFCKTQFTQQRERVGERERWREGDGAEEPSPATQHGFRGPLRERIVDKRKNKKGKWEYLIRWKGYGSNEDTWEPEHHLLHCEEFIDEFNGLHITREKRSRHGKQGSAPKFLRESRGSSVEKISHRPSESGKSKGSTHKRKRINPSLQKQKRGYAAKPASANDRAAKTVTYRTTPSGLQIMPLKKPHNGLQNGDGNHEKDSRHFGNGSQQQNMDLNDHEGEQNLPSVLEVSNDSPVVNGIGSSLANGNLNLHSTVKRKLDGEKDYVFDKRLRYSVRQNESNCRFRDIVVRKEDGFTHILLSSQTSDNNALTPEGFCKSFYSI
ncbi:chromodomain Y-like protein 2 isoform 2-T2 [Porphyrio hochstetteri]